MSKRGGSRGRKEKEPSLRDLSRQFPSPANFERTILGLDTMNERAAALVLSSLVEAHLGRALALMLVPPSTTEWRKLFEDAGAPLGTFSAKITMGHALAIYNSEFRAQLDAFRRVRNAFAHTMIELSFKNELIAKECDLLDPSKIAHYELSEFGKTDPRTRYISLGNYAVHHLQTFIVERHGKLTSGEIAVPTPYLGKYGRLQPDNSQTQD